MPGIRLVLVERGLRRCELALRWGDLHDVERDQDALLERVVGLLPGRYALGADALAALRQRLWDAHVEHQPLCLSLDVERRAGGDGPRVGDEISSLRAELEQIREQRDAAESQATQARRDYREQKEHARAMEQELAVQRKSVARLAARNQDLEQRNAQLGPLAAEVVRLKAEIAELRSDRQKLQKENQALRQQLVRDTTPSRPKPPPVGPSLETEIG